jgi:hypothetical protein
MRSVTLAYVHNNIDDIWEMVKVEPVEVISNGLPVAVVLSPEQFKALSHHSPLGRPRRLGVFSQEFAGFDSDAFLDTDVSQVFWDYSPS